MSFITNCMLPPNEGGALNHKLVSTPNLLSSSEHRINILLGNIHQSVYKEQKRLSDPSVVCNRKASLGPESASQNIQTCKRDINKFLTHIYEKYPEWFEIKQQLLSASKDLTLNISNLEKKLRSVAHGAMGHQIKAYIIDRVSCELEQSTTALKTITDLIIIQDLLLIVKDLQAEKNYLKASFEVLKVEQLINNMPKKKLNDVILTLKSKIDVVKTKLKTEVARMFHQHVRICHVKPKTYQTNTVLKFKKETHELLEVISALVLFDHTLPFKEFCKTFWKSMCKITIMNTTSVKASDSILTVTKIMSTKCSYKDALIKLTKIFTFLHDNFNYSVPGFKTLAFVGNELKVNLDETLVRDCLRNALPHKGMPGVHKEVLDYSKKFERELVTLAIFDAASNPVVEFINEQEITCVTKNCHQYLGTAITIMKRDLTEIVRIGTPYDPKTALTVDEFPECSISRSTVELMEFTDNLLKEAVKLTEISAQQLICTLQSIFYQYGSIVCGHHDRMLQTAPKHVALFRNNCLYIAEELIKFNKFYAAKVENSTSELLFPDQVHQLRTLGGEVFLTFVEEHVSQIETTLEEFQFTSEQIENYVNEDTVYCLKQCMRQYEVLRSVWLKTLPPAVYSKTIGYLLNAFCKKLIDVVLSAMKIPMKSAEQLAAVYKYILAKGPKLFENTRDVRLYVEQWQKLKGLIFVLGAALNDINDYWGNGKGPLTLYFSIDEMKRLLTALFKTNVPSVLKDELFY